MDAALKGLVNFRFLAKDLAKEDAVFRTFNEADV